MKNLGKIFRFSFLISSFFLIVMILFGGKRQGQVVDQYGRPIQPGYLTQPDPYQQLGMYDNRGGNRNYGY